MSDKPKTTIAELIGRAEDPAMEAAVSEFRSQMGRLEQAQYQDSLSPVERLELIWEATAEVIRTYQESEFGS